MPPAHAELCRLSAGWSGLGPESRLSSDGLKQASLRGDISLPQPRDLTRQLNKPQDLWNSGHASSLPNLVHSPVGKLYVTLKRCAALVQTPNPSARA